MKSRRELLSGVFIDLAKAIFVSIVVGKAANPDLIPWLSAVFGIVVSLIMVVIAYKIHPKLSIDEEWKLW